MTCFSELAQSLHSLTSSPFHSVLNEAHKMARHRLEQGGSAVSTCNRQRRIPTWCTLFSGSILTPWRSRKVSEEGWASTRQMTPSGREEKLGGRVVAQRRHVLRLGDGNFAQG